MTSEQTVMDADLHRSIKLAVLAELMRLESDTIAREVTDAELGDIADNVLRAFARHRAPLVDVALDPDIQKIVDEVCSGFRADLARIMQQHGAKEGDLSTAEQCAVIADAGIWRTRALSAEASLAPLVEALGMAHRHIQHQAAWIGKQNAGYSFEALGEDMPTIEAALAPYKATTHD